MPRTKYFRPLDGGKPPLSGEALFARNECRVVAGPARRPRRITWLDRIATAWNNFWQPGPR